MTLSKIAVALLVSLAAFATGPTQAADATADDTAKFLAGMPVSQGSPLAPLTQTPGWRQHASQFDASFSGFEKRQSSKIRAWSDAHLKSPKPTLFYMFSGPDFLYADAFFPKATTYLLAGLEPVGAIPDVTKAPPASVPNELSRLRVSMRTLLSISFFITNHMSSDLRTGRFIGTLPVIYVFLARTGHTIKDVSLVYLDAKGEEKADDAQRAKSQTQGVKITFSKDGRDQTLYYFSTNLANDGVKKSGFLDFAAKLGEGDAFVKSASYLMHGGGFSTVRSFLLDHANTIVQDDTGAPLAYFDEKKWQLDPYGNYVHPISIFSGNYQPNMHQLFVKAKAPKIDFGIGYRYRPNESSLLVATKKTAAAKPPAAAAPPAATKAPEPLAPPAATKAPEPSAPPAATKAPEPPAPPAATKAPEPPATAITPPEPTKPPEAAKTPDTTTPPATTPPPEATPTEATKP
jgi:hypothetical protein